MPPAHAMLRNGRSSDPGQAYLVTFTTAQRQQHFASWDTAADAARLLATSPCWDSAQLLAWVLMPDHWHGLVSLGEGGDLSDCVRRLKGGSARALRQQHPGLGRIWGTASTIAHCAGTKTCPASPVTSPSTPCVPDW